MEIAYVAGLFDGEGMVRIAKERRTNSTSYQVHIMIGMTHEPIIRMLHLQFGGSFYVNDHSKRNPNARPQYCWQACSQNACTFLRLIHPFLVVKKDEAKLALDLQESIDTHKFKLGNRYHKHADHEEIFAYRELLYQTSMQLKRPHMQSPDQAIRTP
jgi:hypothetical protein